MITADMIKPGAVVIDVGINELEGKTVGDVDYEAVKRYCVCNYSSAWWCRLCNDYYDA